MTARTSPAAAIINPTAGPRPRDGEVRGRAERARSAFDRANVNGEVVFTAHAGHGRELAAAFVKRGFSPVIAWGGDGTVNEIASAVAFHDADPHACCYAGLRSVRQCGPAVICPGPHA